MEKSACCVVCAPPFIRRHAHTLKRIRSRGNNKTEKKFSKEWKCTPLSQPHTRTLRYKHSAIVHKTSCRRPAPLCVHIAYFETRRISSRKKQRAILRTKASTHILIPCSPLSCISPVPHDETNEKHRFRRVSISGCVSSRQF